MDATTNELRVVLMWIDGKWEVYSTADDLADARRQMRWIYERCPEIRLDQMTWADARHLGYVTE